MHIQSMCRTLTYDVGGSEISWEVWLPVTVDHVAADCETYVRILIDPIICKAAGADYSRVLVDM